MRQTVNQMTKAYSKMGGDFDDITSIENDEEIAIEEDPVKAAEKQI